MLKVEHGTTVIKGTKIILLAEVTTLIHELVVEEKFFSKEDIDMCVETALLTEEELDKRTNNLRNLSNEAVEKHLSAEDVEKRLKFILS